MRTLSLFVIGVATLMLAGCMETPPLETATGGVTVGQVVERVKCELAYAFSNRINQEQFLWMESWTIKADLTLQGYMSAALTPGVGYTKNFHNAYNRDAGPTTLNGSTIAAIPQVFTVGASANVNELAYRTEVISFSLSLQELRQWLKESEARDPQFFEHCFPAQGTGVEGNLGLAEWVNSALEPVADGQLQAGYHPPPGTAPPGRTTISRYAGPPAGVQTQCKKQISNHGLPYQQYPNPNQQYEDQEEQDPHSHQLDLNQDELIAKITEWRDAVAKFTRENKVHIKNARDQIKNAKELKDNLYKSVKAFSLVLTPMHKGNYTEQWTNFLTIINNRINKISDDISELGSSLDRMNGYLSGAKHGSREDAERACRAAETTYEATIYAQPQDQASAISHILTEIQTANKALPDPPIDALSHSVQFIVNYNAGISPNWSLAVWRGPSLGGSLASSAAAGGGGGGAGAGGGGAGGGGGGGSLASAGGQRQHTLNISAGPPDKADATRLLNNLNIQQAFH